MVALDDERLPGPISFIHLDVEGAEGLALRGARRVLGRDRPLLLVEVHADLLPRVSRRSADDVFADMRALGYTAHALGAGTISRPLTEAPTCGVEPVVFVP
jgi:hypothetical protein